MIRNRSIAPALISLIATTMLIGPGRSVSEAQGWLLENRPYYDPTGAEPRAAQVSLMAYARGDEFPFMVTEGRRRLWDISVGKEIPIVGWEWGSSGNGCIAASSHELVAGCSGFGLWIPISFHVVEDFEDESNPIINTDYRFGSQAKFQHAFSETGRLGVKLQFGHESTHIGDEFTLNALKKYGSEFERVNVSYEYWEYGVSWDQWRGSHLLKFRHGGIRVNDWKRGYYGNHLLGSDEATLTPSVANFEPSFGFEWLQDAGDQGVGVGAWKLFTSADARLRTVYGYHRERADSPDRRQWSASVMVGLRRAEQAFEQKGVPQFAFRLYTGVNPNGQFRSQASYFQWGIGIFVPV